MHGKKTLSALITMLLAICLIFCITGCGDESDDTCSHSWTDATCAEPKTCSECGETEGDKLGHTWSNATCVLPKTCSVCHATEGEATGHAWNEADCTNPKTCSVCEATEGEPIGHIGGTATCTAKAVCTVCHNEYGEPNSDNHSEAAFVYTSNENGTHLKKHICCGTVAEAGEACSGGNATCKEKAVCTLCNATYGEIGTHKFDESVWGYKAADGHAHLCTTPGCEEHDTVKSHTSSGGPTETTPSVCSECQYIIAPATGHITHTPSSYWNYDSTGHWHGCVGCSAMQFSKAAHNYDNDCDSSCNTCGYRRAVTHSYTVLNQDSTNHWYECATCHAIKPDSQKAHEGGNATCRTKSVCEVCNIAYGSFSTTVHSSEEYTYITNNNNTHVKKHTCCGAVEITEEACSGGSATCTAKAVCDYCSKAYGNMLAHTGGEATCTAKAICSACNNPYGELTAHSYTEEVADTVYRASAATCESPATYYKTCSCGAVGTETFESGSALNHNYGDWVTANGSHTRTCKNDATHIETAECSGGTATCEAAAICSVCDEEYEEALGHDFESVEWQETEAPSCTAVGKQTATCGRDGCVATQTKDIEAKGHTWNITNRTCTEGQVCTVGGCGATVDALGHDYKPSVSTEATCTKAATVTYTCDRGTCGDSYTEDVGSPKGHNTEGSAITLTAVEGVKCTFVQHYTCQNDGCGADVVGQTVVSHENYTASIVTPATCAGEGLKRLVCAECGLDERTEAIPKDTVTGHSWDEGTEADGVTTYTCQNAGCEIGTKTVVSVGKEDTVNAKDFKDTELDLGDDIKVTLGDAGDFIGDDDVSVSVDTVNKEALLTPEQLIQVGSNEVYDFSIKDSNGLPVDFEGNEGKITVSIPYTLKPGENVDNIAVWYIADDGSLKAYEATYNNGYVTFETDHFSYYTVTELTPKQRCELYGHNYRDKKVEATCTDDGYTLKYCIRCGDSQKIIDEDSALGHNYTVDEEKTTSATCNAAGKTAYECIECGHTYTVKVPATGHNIKETAFENTCTETGYTLCECINEGCDYSYTDKLTQPKSHLYDYEFIWSDDYSEAYCVVTCDNEGCDYEETIEIEDVLLKNIPASCEKKGMDEYTVIITHNGKIKVDKKEKERDDQPSGHAYGNSFEYDEADHWHVCSKCGTDKSTAEAHEFKTGIVLKAPTCSETGTEAFACKSCDYVNFVELPATEEHSYIESDFKADSDGHWNECSSCGNKCNEAEHNFESETLLEANCSISGEAVHSCSICNYTERETIPATGIHNYDGGVCASCGRLEGSCNHEALTAKVIDLSVYGMCEGQITVMSCECGEAVYLTSYSFGKLTCAFEQTNGNSGIDENGREYESATLVCSVCDAEIYLYATLESQEYCTRTISYECTFIFGDTVILDKATMTMTNEYHNWTEDKIDLSEYSSCGGFGVIRKCADCGIEGGITQLYINCEVDESMGTAEEVTGDDGILHKITTVTCPDCGLVYVYDNYTVVESACISWEYSAKSIYHNGELLGYTMRFGKQIGEHAYEYSYEFDDKEGTPNCENGITVTETCKDCGDTYSYHRTYHSTNLTESYDFSDYGACGGYIRIYTCPCGQEGRMNSSIGCYNDSKSETITDENGIKHSIHTYICSECGKVITRDTYTIKDGCKQITYAKFDITVNGEVILSTEGVYSIDYYHNYEYTYVFDDKEGTPNCENGVTVTRVCKDCGDTYSNYRTYHSTNLTESYDFSDYGACEGYIRIYTCPCGQEGWMDYYYGCYNDSKSETITDENGIKHSIRTYTCSECGKVLTRDTYTVKDGCKQITYAKFDITVNGEAVLSAEGISNTSYYHNYEYTYEFDDKEGTPNCENGVTVTRVCKDCGDTYTYRYTYHSTNLTESYDFSDYGACEGYIRIYACPCGQEGRMDYYYGCYDNSKSETITDENGIKHSIRTYTCSECGKVLTIDTYTVKDGCKQISYRKFNMTVNGEVVLSAEGVYDYYYNHDYEYSYEFDDKEGAPNCENGVTVTRVCKDCGDTYTYRNTSHETHLKESYALSEYGACGEGYVRYYECACGKVGSIDCSFPCGYYTSNTYKDEEGKIHNVYASACNTCGLRYQNDSYTVRDASTCTQITYYNVSVNTNEALVAEFSYASSTSVSHNYVASGKLNEGSASCTDGVTITYTCSDCGGSYNRNYTSHVLFEKERYDLTKEEYGACYHDGFVIVNSCACGLMSDISLSDSLCEFDQRTTDCWVEGYLSGYNYTAAYPESYHSNNYYAHSSYTLGCVVTNPHQCDYRIRYSTYYLPVAGECKAEQWETWQIGYNAETGEYKYEISVRTGNIRTYHPYVLSSMNENYDDGTRKVSGTRYDCPDCGSYYYSANYYREDGTRSHRDVYYENTLNDGNRKIYHAHYEYDENGSLILGKYTYTAADGSVTWNQTEYIYNNSYTYTLGGVECEGYEEKTVYTNSEGETHSNEYAYVWYKGYNYYIYELVTEINGYWYRYDYSYNFDGTCEMTTTYTNSNGEKDVRTEDCHQIYYWNWVIDIYPTCTQDGYKHQYCEVCEGKFNENTVINPYKHSWSYISENHYYCSRCGLENANGADGDIVFEDYTESHGNGEYYVAGYWAQNDVQFIYNVSLILHTALENGDNQIILEDIEISELNGVRALAFKKADVIAAAEALGYTADMYDVRLSFVPVGADESHDYAITFTDDSINADIVISDSEQVKFSMNSTEIRNITITPITSGLWTMYSICDFDSYATLYDSEGNILISNDDGNGNGDFRIAYELAAGETYTLSIRPYSNGSYEGEQIVFVLFEAPVHEHSWQFDADNSSLTLIDGEEAIYEGTICYVCKGCGEAYSIEATNIIEYVTEANCEQEGQRWYEYDYINSETGTTERGTVIIEVFPGGHNYNGSYFKTDKVYSISELKIIFGENLEGISWDGGMYPNDCGEINLAIATCTDCEKQLILQAYGDEHILYENEIIEPTCTDSGYIYYSCACGEFTEIEEPPATGHNMMFDADNSVLTLIDGEEAIYEGTICMVCTVCGEAYSVEATNIIEYVTEANCEQEGQRWYEYDYINHETGNTSKGSVIIEKTKTIHNFNGFKLTDDTVTLDELEAMGGMVFANYSPIDCMNPGLGVATCSDCDRTYVVNVLGEHVLYENEIVEPTCTSDGYIHYSCACGEVTELEILDAIGHEAGELIKWSDDNNEYAGYYCMVCQELVLISQTPISVKE